METFIKPVDLLSELCSIATNAEKELIIVCPYVMLHHHFKRSLKPLLKNNSVKITFLYGKFSQTDHYQLTDIDLEFLQSFPNIKIFYHERLHAKFYANEKTALVTTLNLNHSSPNNNLEYGIKLNDASYSVAKEIRAFISDIVEDSTLIFEKIPENQTSTHKNSFSERITEIRTEHSNAYERWTKEDDEKLEQLFCEEKNIKELSKFFNRQPSAIRARVNKLELHEKYGL